MPPPTQTRPPPGTPGGRRAALAVSNLARLAELAQRAEKRPAG